MVRGGVVVVALYSISSDYIDFLQTETIHNNKFTKNINANRNIRNLFLQHLSQAKTGYKTACMPRSHCVRFRQLEFPILNSEVGRTRWELIGYLEPTTSTAENPLIYLPVTQGTYATITLENRIPGHTYLIFRSHSGLYTIVRLESFFTYQLQPSAPILSHNAFTEPPTSAPTARPSTRSRAPTPSLRRRRGRRPPRGSRSRSGLR